MLLVATGLTLPYSWKKKVVYKQWLNIERDNDGTSGITAPPPSVLEETREPSRVSKVIDVCSKLFSFSWDSCHYHCGLLFRKLKQFSHPLFTEHSLTNHSFLKDFSSIWERGLNMYCTGHWRSLFAGNCIQNSNINFPYCKLMKESRFSCYSEWIKFGEGAEKVILKPDRTHVYVMFYIISLIIKLGG